MKGGHEVLFEDGNHNFCFMLCQVGLHSAARNQKPDKMYLNQAVNIN